MSELLKAVLVDKAARKLPARKLVAGDAAAMMTPWNSVQANENF